MADPVFYIIAVGVCLFAFLTVTSRDVFHSAVWLSMTLLNTSAVYFYLGAQFLGVIQVLVYVGGIVTLFVFAIKLTARIGDKTIKQTNDQLVLSGIASLVLFFLIFKIILTHPWAAASSQTEVLSLKKLGESLVTVYVLPFEFISLLLLAVMVGAIVIGKVKK